MRRAFVAAVALAPLCLAASPSLVRATETVSGSRSTAIATSTATGTAAADIDITGSVTVKSTTPAVTLDSSNNVTNAGTISITGVSGSTGVLLTGGNTGTLTNTGAIDVTESYTATTNSNDDYTEEPYASGSDRYGIRLTGTSALAGDIVNSGTIYVQGNDSYGISIEAPLTGSITNSGTIEVLGDNSFGLSSTSAGSISGSVLVTDVIEATGKGSSAINLQGSVGGSVSVYSDIYATAYATTTRSTTDSTLTKIQATSTQVEQSGAAVTIGGSVAGGIYIGAAPVGTTTDSTADVDGDGIEDGYEGAGSITNYGSAAGLLVGSSGANITIGEYGTDASVLADNAYGLIIEGSVNGFGTYDGVTATALQIGTGDGQVTIDGGIRVIGSITAESYEADATAIHILSGATTPEILNEDFIEALVEKSTLSTSEIAATAYGINIEAGANVTSLTNIGTLQAVSYGDNKSAVAVVDSSGTLTNILNEGVISAIIEPTATGDTITGSSTALDLRANTTGITLVQQINADPITIETDTTTSTSGVVTTTAAASTTTTSSSSTTTTTVTTTAAGVTTTTATTTPTYPEILGDILLGNGNNTVELLGGEMIGALSMGSGTDTLTIDNANYAGALTYSGSALALSVTDGALLNTSATTLKLSSLNVGSGGLLYAAIDPTNSASTLYSVSGTATFASGSALGIYLVSPLYAETSYTIVSAANLINNSTAAVTLSEVPYLLVGTATTDTTAGTITVDLRQRTAAEMGLNPGQTSALSAVYNSLTNDSSIESAFLEAYTRASFLGLYNQMLPDYSGGLFQLAAAASDAVTRATASTNEISNPSGTRGVWAQEVAYGVQRPAANAAGYQGSGFGFIGGLELGGGGLGAFGLTGAFLTGSLKDPSLPGDGQSSFSEGEFGGYWQGQYGGLKLDARVGVGYMLLSDRRQLYETTSTGTISLERDAKASSSGYSGTGHFGVGYETGQVGLVYFRPQAQFDYFRLYEGGYTEHGGGTGFDLAVDSRTGNQTSASASMVTGLNFTGAFHWRPELELGYRDVMAGDAGATTARFAADTESFTLEAAKIVGGGPLARLSVKADTDFYELNVSAGAEYRNRYTEGDVKFSFRVLF